MDSLQAGCANHREKAGSRSDAIKLYAIRKAAVLKGQKLPPNLRHRGATLAQIGQEAIDWYKSHERKDLRTFSGRMNTIIAALGDRVANDMTPGQIDTD